MTQEWHSAKRQRTYKRKFDHDLARRLWNNGKGMTIRSIADKLGVTHHAVWRVIKQPTPVMTVEPQYRRPTYRCPTCQGPKSKYAELCRECRKDVRLAPPKLVARHKRIRPATLFGVEPGRIVKLHDDFAVVELLDQRQQRLRVLHWWAGPAEIVDGDITVQEVLGWNEYA